MSFDPTTYPLGRYSGTPNFATLAQDAVQDIHPLMGKRCVPLKINWLVQFTALNSAPDILIPIQLTGGNNQGGLLDKIRAVKIDNTNSGVPITVYFPDTGDLIVAAPDSVVQGPVVTNGATCYIVAQNLNAGNLPVTSIFLYNFYLPPFVDTQAALVYPQWVGSPTIQRGSIVTPGFGPPCLGDQTAQYMLDMNGGQNVVILGSPQASGFYYIQNLQITGAMVQAPGGQAVTSFIAGSISGTLYTFSAGADNVLAKVLPVYAGNSLNLRLRADEIWTFHCLANPGISVGSKWVGYINYSYNPNT